MLGVKILFNTNRNTKNNNIRTKAISFRCNEDEQCFLEIKSSEFSRKKSDLIREALIFYVTYLESKKSI
jgi:hypothetical protein